MSAYINCPRCGHETVDVDNPSVCDCDCGCTYGKDECPNCDTLKARVKELEDIVHISNEQYRQDQERIARYEKALGAKHAIARAEVSKQRDRARAAEVREHKLEHRLGGLVEKAQALHDACPLVTSGPVTDKGTVIDKRTHEDMTKAADELRAALEGE